MIRVLVPDMPTADELLPYLREIDREKSYSNGGPLVEALEAEALAASGLSPRDHAACAVSSGTAALELALMALGLPAGAEVAVPALTFRATAQAVVSAGLRPVYCDVDPALFQLQPSAVPEGVDVALPVAAYGRALPVELWEAWASRYPERRVVMDCAGAMGNQQAPLYHNVVACFSLHATKFVGAGEGGLIVCGRRLAYAVRQLASFGDVRGASNRRMSEYHAAVALASLRRATKKAEALDALAEKYAAALAAACPEVAVLRPRRLASRSSLLVVALPLAEKPNWAPAANGLASAFMRKSGVETRLWYRPFPQELASLGSPHEMPRHTAEASRSHLGLPFHTAMSERDVPRACDALAAALRKI